MYTTQLVPLYCDKHYSQLAGGYKNNNRGEFIMLLCLLLIFPHVSFMMSLLLVFISYLYTVTYKSIQTPVNLNNFKYIHL